MIRRATIRLPTAVMLATAGGMVAILWGRADAAVLVTPWVVLLLLGLAGAKRQNVSGSVTANANRVLAGDEVTILTRVSGANGWVQATCRPAGDFASDAKTDTGTGAGTTETGNDTATGKDTATGDDDESGSDRSGLDGRQASGAAHEEIAGAVADVSYPGRTTELRTTLTASGWGAHDIGRVDLQIHEPYGLLRWSGSLHTTFQVRVHPRPIDLRRLLAPWFVRRLTGAHRSKAVARGIEYADVRPFAPGDSLRDINWRASARSDEIWVSQRHPERSTDVILLLDTFTESGHDVRTALGMAIEAAVGLAESHLTVTDRVGLIEIGGIVRWVSPGTGQHQLQRLTDALLATKLYENAAERNHLVLPPRVLPPRSFVVALSPLLDARFIDSLSTLRASGHDVSVVEIPPLLPRSGDDDRNRSQSSRLAYRLWQAERTITRDQLAQHGVAVATWKPGQHFDQVLLGLTRRRLGSGRGRPTAIGGRA